MAYGSSQARESNPCHNRNLCHRCGNAGSLAHCHTGNPVFPFIGDQHVRIPRKDKKQNLQASHFMKFFFIIFLSFMLPLPSFPSSLSFFFLSCFVSFLPSIFLSFFVSIETASVNIKLIVLLNDFYFFHYSWFTVSCHFSTVQQGDPVTHTYIHSFFSHYHAPSK